MHKVNIPDLLSYPKILPIKDVPELYGKSCYIIEKYNMDGVAMLIYRNSGNMFIRYSDFGGVLIDIENLGDYKGLVDEIMADRMPIIISILKAINLDKAIFYFVNCNGAMLVDVRFEFNKFCSPGAMVDIFKRVRLQNVLDKGVVDGNYDKYRGVIVKPFIFKSIVRDGAFLPMYGVIL